MPATTFQLEQFRFGLDKLLAELDCLATFGAGESQWVQLRGELLDLREEVELTGPPRLGQVRQRYLLLRKVLQGLVDLRSRRSQACWRGLGDLELLAMANGQIDEQQFDLAAAQLDHLSSECRSLAPDPWDEALADLEEILQGLARPESRSQWQTLLVPALERLAPLAQQVRARKEQLWYDCGRYRIPWCGAEWEALLEGEIEVEQGDSILSRLERTWNQVCDRLLLPPTLREERIEAVQRALLALRSAWESQSADLEAESQFCSELFVVLESELPRREFWVGQPQAELLACLQGILGGVTPDEELREMLERLPAPREDFCKEYLENGELESLEMEAELLAGPARQPMAPMLFCLYCGGDLLPPECQECGYQFRPGRVL